MLKKLALFIALLYTGEPLTAQAYTPQWDIFIRNIRDSTPASIATDLGWGRLAPVKEQPLVVMLSLRMQSPQKNGLPSVEETPVLNQIEESMAALLEDSLKMTYAGRISYQGIRELYFYTNDTSTYLSTIREVMYSFPDYTYYSSAAADKEWQAYFNILYPTGEELQAMLNQGIISKLASAGDNLSKTRVIFKTEKEKDAFLRSIAEAKFKIIKNDFNMSEKLYPYTLRIAKFQKAEPRLINRITLYLYQKAKRSNGLYNKWECEPTR
jgi:Family of unknown function (DUF695)/Regulator of ribonuclease activity B